jgi:hypothetical protein
VVGCRFGASYGCSCSGDGSNVGDASLKHCCAANKGRQIVRASLRRTQRSETVRRGCVRRIRVWFLVTKQGEGQGEGEREIVSELNRARTLA